MKQFLKHHLTYSDIFLILINIVPVYGVWFEQWDAKQVFIIYCLESVIMGIYNVLMMWLTTLVRKKDLWTNGSYSSMVSGYWFILFFIVHYGFFLFVQVSIFLGVSNMSSESNDPSGFFDLLFHIRNYLPPELQWVLLLFFVSYGIIVLKDFVIPGLYKRASLSVLMFAPYARIFVQQICVILGGVCLVFGAGKIFIVIFVAVKLFFETIIDYEKMLESSAEKIK